MKNLLIILLFTITTSIVVAQTKKSVFNPRTTYNFSDSIAVEATNLRVIHETVKYSAIKSRLLPMSTFNHTCDSLYFHVVTKGKVTTRYYVWLTRKDGKCVK